MESDNLHGGHFISDTPCETTPTPTNNKTMANYYATARSNYFAVKDEQAFREWADGLGLMILEPSEVSEDLIDRFGISPGDDDGGG